MTRKGSMELESSIIESIQDTFESILRDAPLEVEAKDLNEQASQALVFVGNQLSQTSILSSYRWCAIFTISAPFSLLA